MAASPSSAIAVLGGVAALGAMAACSLVVSTDGLSGDAANAAESGGETVPDGGSNDEGIVDGGSSSGSVDPSSATSCADILRANPSAESGAFTIGARTLHCEMSLAGGGWTRAIDLDAARDGCPSAWRFDAEPGGCRRATNQVDGVVFDAPLSSFTEVLLSAVGRQRASPDAFHSDDLDRAYMDGVSVTTTIDGKRAHVFSFAVGLTEDATIEPENHCPCDKGARTPASFVGANFLCDTAVTTGYPEEVWQTTKDLWAQDARGADCTKAVAPGPRLSTVKLPSASAGPLEVRLMADQPRSNEDVALKRLVVYVR
ncbi:MAG: hypothetical protein KIT84_10855 [Labilithrix sp.]|nr:hypothetical protein [Labilithrix sp.]MCW5811506.1 hypothetical protein [Labilithrix sp.]